MRNKLTASAVRESRFAFVFRLFTIHGFAIVAVILFATCATGSSPGKECEEGLVRCDGVCVDLESNVYNCGACGNACGDGEVCSGGECSLSCQMGQQNCGGSCVNLQNDPANCGSCGNECGDGEVCSGGECSLSCQMGQENCGGSCVNLQNDSSNCGACGNECGQGEVCTNGVCELSCPPGFDDCGGSCVNLQNDSSNCGACGNACGEGEVCTNGVCELSCPPGFDDCGGVCVNLDNDEDNCGFCGIACGEGEICTSGVCELVCPPGFEDCGGVCVDLDTDENNCGACGNDCAIDETCELGVCTLVSTCDPTQNIALTAGTTASSSGGGTGEWGPHKMIDGYGEPYCSTHQFHWVFAESSPGGDWIRMDFPSPQVVGRIVMDTAHAYSEICDSGTGRTLAGATIQWWNGSSWITDGSVSGRTDDWSYVFTSPVETTGLRLYDIYATDVIFQRSNPIIAEWEVYCN